MRRHRNNVLVGVGEEFFHRAVPLLGDGGELVLVVVQNLEVPCEPIAGDGADELVVAAIDLVRRLEERELLFDCANLDAIAVLDVDCRNEEREFFLDCCHHVVGGVLEVEGEGEVFLGNEKRQNQPACGKVLLDNSNLLSVLAEDTVRIGYRPGFLVDNEGVSMKKWVHFCFILVLVFIQYGLQY